MVETEQKAEHKLPPIEQTSSIRNTHEKLSSVLNNRTLRDITLLLDPYKRNSSDSLINTLTHVTLLLKNTQTSTITRLRITTYHTIITSNTICSSIHDYSF